MYGRWNVSVTDDPCSLYASHGSMFDIIVIYDGWKVPVTDNLCSHISLHTDQYQNGTLICRKRFWMIISFPDVENSPWMFFGPTVISNLSSCGMEGCFHISCKLFSSSELLSFHIYKSESSMSLNDDHCLDTPFRLYYNVTWLA